MKKINLKKFIKKYRPTYPLKNSKDYEGYMWTLEDSEETIRNKFSSYIWTIVKDPDLGIIAVPYKDLTNSIGFFIATEARTVEGYEYVRL